MTLPRVLVSATHRDHTGAVALVDFNLGTCDTVLPYRIGGITGSADRVYVVQIDTAMSHGQLEEFDCHGALSLRRLNRCVDAHSLVQIDDGFALACTALNQVAFLDRHGIEKSRWSPNDRSEPDSWHINSLYSQDGRLVSTYFGRHTRFREWAAAEFIGGIVEIPSGRTLVEGLARPHDPVRVPGGWIVNDSARFRTVFCSDAGELDVIAEFGLFTRGLIVTDEFLIVGLSGSRHLTGAARSSEVVLVDRGARAVAHRVALSFSEVGHLLLAPSDAVLAAMQRHGRHATLLDAEHAAYGPDDRRGTLRVLLPPPFLPTVGCYPVRIQVVNKSDKDWSSHNRPSLKVGGRVFNAQRDTCGVLTPLTPIPVPVLAHGQLTFDIEIDFASLPEGTDAAVLELTLLQNDSDWWSSTATWSPMTITLQHQPRPPAPEPEHRPDTKTLPKAPLARRMVRVGFLLLLALVMVVILWHCRVP